MNLNQPTFFAAILTKCLAFMMMGPVVSGQSTLMEQDTLIAQYTTKVGSYEGVVLYDYILKDKDSILVGDFSFSNALLNTAESERHPVNIHGQFRNGLPDGDWHFEFNELVPNEDKSLVKYQYVTTVNGLKQSTKFTLNRGQPQGQWITQVDSVVNSSVSQTLFKSVIEYSSGVPIKNFSIESRTDIMLGRLLRDGSAQDLWSLYSKEEIGVEEDWMYDNGLLKQIVLESDTGRRSVDLSYQKSTQYVNVNLDQHYLDIMQLRMKQQDTSFVFNQRMSGLLKLDSEYYQMVLDFFEGFGLPLNVQGFVVRVPEFPLSPQEEGFLKQISSRVRSSDSLVASILTDAQMNLLKINDTETAFLYQVALQLDQQYLEPLNQLVSFKERDLLQHIDREEAIKGLWPSGLPPQRIQLIDSTGSTRIFQLPEEEFTIGSGLEGINEHTKLVLGLSQQLDVELKRKLTYNKREKAFLQQEQLLIAEVKALEAYVDSLNVGMPQPVSEALESLKSFAQQELKTYVNMEEAEEKLKYSSKLASCFKTTRGLAKTLENLPDQEREIAELYQDQVWNPFTATVMDEEVKRRITRAYRVQLIPYYLKKVREQLTCDNIKAQIDEFDRLHERMIKLRQEDTKKLERKLKRTKDPEEVLERLDL